MAAVCEPAALSISTHGVAFEVDIKNPEAAQVMTPVRARLEKEAASGRPLPRLLRSSCDAVPHDSPESPQKEGIAKRARVRNEKKQAAAQRARRDYEEQMDLKRTSLERDLEKAAQNRQTSLADISSKAGKHFEDVKAKVGDVQLQQATAIAERQRRLEETLAQKGAAHLAGLAERVARAGKHFEEVKAKVGDVQRQQADATAEQQRRLEETLAQRGAAHSTGVAERGTKAGEHNGRVAERVQKHQEGMQRRLERLREQQQVAQQRADELREQFRRKSSSKVSVSAPATPSGKSGSAAGGAKAACMSATSP